MEGVTLFWRCSQRRLIPIDPLRPRSTVGGARSVKGTVVGYALLQRVVVPVETGAASLPRVWARTALLFWARMSRALLGHALAAPVMIRIGSPFLEVFI
jgi:hypothetical protein